MHKELKVRGHTPGWPRQSSWKRRPLKEEEDYKAWLW